MKAKNVRPGDVILWDNKERTVNSVEKLGGKMIIVLAGGARLTIDPGDTLKVYS